MGRPQQPELNRSGRTPLQPDSLESELEARQQKRPGQGDADRAPVPEDNRPGHHPDREQDQPDRDAFVRRFSGSEDDGDEGAERANGAASSEADRSLLHELGGGLFQRVRKRDVIGLATFPLWAGVRTIRHYRSVVEANGS